MNQNPDSLDLSNYNLWRRRLESLSRLKQHKDKESVKFSKYIIHMMSRSNAIQRALDSPTILTYNPPESHLFYSRWTERLVSSPSWLDLCTHSLNSDFKQGNPNKYYSVKQPCRLWTSRVKIQMTPLASNSNPNQPAVRNSSPKSWSLPPILLMEQKQTTATRVNKSKFPLQSSCL